ncbi:amidase [Acuticoccus mangrovi]|uniref:Indoleacetamide hydrolase n=1 Tax=Acuticoccus mangrovi TaxID=2796142 RepID=A0A934MEB2_9HYPH|nr:amidase [Acuticoccus mangrovi]MBJ3777297.1 amidase [Acuticoccus mangrovi]
MSHSDVVAKTVAACEAAEPRLHAFTRIMGDTAMEEARHLDALAAAGVDLGPLHGVPVVVKDIIDVAGVPTLAGSATRAGATRAKSDAFVVKKLRAAGAVVVAKVNTVEYAFGGWGTNANTGHPRNPWKPDESHTTGGSSSGTGAAVGGGIVPAGLGTDTGGSVRIPAAMCGCVGLKTSIGLVSRAGVVPLSDTFDSIGPLTDTVRRAAEMLDVMQGEDRDDPSTVGIARKDPFAELDRGGAGLRVGRLSDTMLEDASPEVRADFEKSVALLEAAGVTVVPIELPHPMLEYQRRATVIIATDAYAFHADMAESNEAPLNDTTRTRILQGKSFTARDRVLAQRRQVTDINDFLAAIDHLDAVVLPTAPITAMPHTKVNEDDYSVSLYTRMGNYLALCGLSVPIGLTAEGVPTALQILTRRFDDPLALRIGEAFESVRGPFPTPPSL